MVRQFVAYPLAFGRRDYFKIFPTNGLGSSLSVVGSDALAGAPVVEGDTHHIIQGEVGLRYVRNVV